LEKFKIRQDRKLKAKNWKMFEGKGYLTSYLQYQTSSVLEVRGKELEVGEIQKPTKAED